MGLEIARDFIIYDLLVFDSKYFDSLLVLFCIEPDNFGVESKSLNINNLKIRYLIDTLWISIKYFFKFYNR